MRTELQLNTAEHAFLSGLGCRNWQVLWSVSHRARFGSSFFFLFYSDLSACLFFGLAFEFSSQDESSSLFSEGGRSVSDNEMSVLPPLGLLLDGCIVLLSAHDALSFCFFCLLSSSVNLAVKSEQTNIRAPSGRPRCCRCCLKTSVMLHMQDVQEHAPCLQTRHFCAHAFVDRNIKKGFPLIWKTTFHI